jgi:hypothetical protein
MLKDVADSKRINMRIAEQWKTSEDTEVGRIYWDAEVERISWDGDVGVEVWRIYRCLWTLMLGSFICC